MSNMQITDWQSLKPVIASRKPQGYITLPVFTYTDVPRLGTSDLVVQFNFSAPKNFCISTLPTRPLNTNYILCIKYRVGSVVYRYKLWDHDDGNVQYPAYSNQLIRANFCLEIWSVSSSTEVSNSVARQILTSLLTDITNLSVIANYSVADSAVCVNINAFVPVYPTGADTIYRLQNVSTDFSLDIDAQNSPTQIALIDKANSDWRTTEAYVDTIAGWLGVDEEFVGLKNYIINKYPLRSDAGHVLLGVSTVATVALLCKFPTGGAVGTSLFNDRQMSVIRTAAAKITISDYGQTPAVVYDVAINQDTWLLITVGVVRKLDTVTNSVSLKVFDFATSVLISEYSAEGATNLTGYYSNQFALGDLSDNPVPLAADRLAHLAVFNVDSNSIEWTETIFPQLRSYLQYVHLLAQNYDPYNLPTCVAWLDNTI